MPKYKITKLQTVQVAYVVEADDENTAIREQGGRYVDEYDEFNGLRSREIIGIEKVEED